MCLCLTHLRNRQGPWVQANLKTEQERERSRGRSYTGRVKEGARLVSSAKIKKKKVGMRWVENCK